MHDRWGEPYYTINEKGHVCIRPFGKNLEIYETKNRIGERDISDYETAANGEYVYGMKDSTLSQEELKELNLEDYNDIEIDLVKVVQSLLARGVNPPMVTI